MSENIYIRLVNPAWSGHNGYFGQVPFKDGRSIRPVTRNEADLIAALTRVETEEGEAVGMAHRLIGGATIPAPVLEPLARQSDADKAAEDAKAKLAGGAAPAPAEAVLKVYTVEELQAVADKDGITGLRAIAKPLGVKGRAITELLSEIMREQEQRFGKTPQEASPSSADAPEGEEQPPAEDAKEESSEAGEGAKEESSEAPRGGETA